MRYGLLGGRLGHSYSPWIHARMGIPDYVLAECDENDLRRLLEGRDFCGLNVTIPYKKTVIPFLDRVSGDAARVGAVNTILNDGGRLLGYNTDLTGFERMLELSGIPVDGKNVLVLGTGGTSVTVRDVLKGHGARFTAVSRSGPVDYENVYEKCRDTEVIVNTTPVGMWPDMEGCPLEPERFPRLTGVLDVIYHPKETQLVRRARGMGLAAGGGLSMLVYQAAASEEIWTGKRFTDRELDELLTQTEEMAE